MHLHHLNIEGRPKSHCCKGKEIYKKNGMRHNNNNYIPIILNNNNYIPIILFS